MKVCPKCRRCFEDSASRCPLDDNPLKEEFSGPLILDRKYRLEKKIGQGGMGSVYLATHLGLNKHFALKTIEPTRSLSESVEARFTREATVLGQLKHPNIVQVTDFGKDNREHAILYLVMELLEGRTLSELVHAKRFDPQLALVLLEQLAAGLDFAHSQGILHRDLKSGNVIVTGESEEQQAARILDFGLAGFIPRKWGATAGEKVSLSNPARSIDQTRRMPELRTHPMNDAISSNVETFAPDEDQETFDVPGNNLPGQANVDVYRSLTEVGHVMGTPAYMSPEQIRGETLTEASDLYSFGVLAFEVITGHLPFRGDSKAVMQQHLEVAPPLLSTMQEGVSPELAKALMLPLAKDPAARPKTASEFVKQLRQAEFLDRELEWKKREWIPRWKVAGAIGFLMSLLMLSAGLFWPVRAMENAVVQFWFGLKPVETLHPGILIVSIDEPSLDANKANLSDWGDEVGHGLSFLFESGARGIAMDVMHKNWAESDAFLQALLGHPDQMVFAAITSNGDVVGPEFTEGFLTLALGPEKTSSLFAYTNILQDPDGVIRKMPAYYILEDKKTSASFPLQAARWLTSPLNPKHQDNWISLALNEKDFPRISWKDIRKAGAQQFRGKVILIGAEYTGVGDDHRISNRGWGSRQVTGLDLSAMMIHTAAEGFPFDDSKTRGNLITFPLTFLWATLISMSLLWSTGTRTAIGLICASIVMLLLTAYLLFLVVGMIVPAAAPVLFSVFTVVPAILIRRKLAVRPKMQAPPVSLAVRTDLMA